MNPRDIGARTASLAASYEFYFGKRTPMTRYEYKSVPDTPLTRVVVDGKPAQEFTSLAAAKAWVEHKQKLDHEDFVRADRRFAAEWAALDRPLDSD